MTSSLYRTEHSVIVKNLMKALLLIVAFFTMALYAQESAFEVASVKMSPPRAGTAAYTTQDKDLAMVRYSNITLKNLIAIAYNMDSRLVIGPDWIDEVSYDIAAKLPPGTPTDLVPAMMKTLLRERFKLAVHQEAKEQRSLLLVVSKAGPKLKPGRDGGGQNQIWSGRLIGRAMSIELLAALLARVLENHVVNKTGLSGEFDIDLKFTPENSDQPGPSIFTAIQEQLGLKLEAGKAQVNTLRVDYAERIPTEN